MNQLDLIILAALGFFFIKGLIRGFFHEVLGLVGVLVALILATKYMSEGAAWINRLLQMAPALASALGFLLIFFFVILLTQLLIHAFQRLFRYAMLGWLEKLAGATVGLLKGATIVSLLLILFSAVPFMDDVLPGTRDSRLYAPLRNFAPAVFNQLMEWFPNSKSFYGEVKESVDQLSGSNFARNTQDFLRSFQTDSDAKPQNEPPR